MNVSENLTRFFNNWADCVQKPSCGRQLLSSSLDDFFVEWGLLGLSTLSPRVAHAYVHPDSLSELFRRLDNPLRVWRASGAYINVWKVAGIGRDELRNVRVLAWLLDPHGSHGQMGAFMSCLLNGTVSRLPKGFPTTESLGLTYRVQTEERPSGDNKNRVDIVIDGQQALLFIEAKIDARESEGQLERYYEIVESRANKKQFGLLFLTVNECFLGGRLSSMPNLVNITWAGISRELRSYASALEDSHHLKRNLLDFCMHIESFSRGA